MVLNFISVNFIPTFKNKGKMEDEKWQSISGFGSYFISSNGRVRSIKRTVPHGSNGKMTLKGRVMKQRWHKIAKALFLDLMDDEKKRRTVYPHKEVAKAFVVRPSEEHVMIVHKDNNPRNNKAENLQWMTKSEHMKWQFKVGNKDNFKVWEIRKKRYANGFKPDTVLPGRPRKNQEVA